MQYSELSFTHVIQVVRFDAESSQVTVKFVDHGGYYNFPASDLKQIRSDYLALPFQVSPFFFYKFTYLIHASLKRSIFF